MIIKNSLMNRSLEEEEGVRASEKIDRILSHLSNSNVVVKGKHPVLVGASQDHCVNSTLAESK